jgi:hypothetical protein
MLFPSVSAPTAYISFHGTSASAPLVSVLSIDLVELAWGVEGHARGLAIDYSALSSSHLRYLISFGGNSPMYPRILM